MKNITTDRFGNLPQLALTYLTKVKKDRIIELDRRLKKLKKISGRILIKIEQKEKSEEVKSVDRIINNL